MQNDTARIGSLRTGLFARRTGFAAAARADTIASQSTAASAPKPMSATVMERSSFSALSVLSDATTGRTSTATATQDTTVKPAAFMSRANDRSNPFLQRPARKLFKHDNQVNSAAAPSSATSTIPAKAAPNSSTTNNPFLAPASSRKSSTTPAAPAAPASKPNMERLTLTRVMPLNSPIKPGAKSIVSVASNQEQQDAPHSMSFSFFGQRRAPASTTPSNSNIVPEAHGSTTPKMTPNPKYFEALNTSHAEPAPRLDLIGLAQGKKATSSREHPSETTESAAATGKGETEDPASTAAEAFDSTALAFARKSIMRHARSKPQTIIQSVARAAEEHKDTPSYTTLLSASTYAPRQESLESAADASQVPNTRLPDSKESNASDTTKSFATTSNQKPSSAQMGVSSSVWPPPASESRSVLDFSGRTAPAASSTTWTAAISARPVPSDSLEQRTEVPFTNGAARMPENVRASQSRFDLREALLSESSRSKYELPSLTASQAPHSSAGFSKTAPYQIPSAKERQEMRADRRPGYKALPLNPKIFTSAGDMGVPRIPKAPLTVPRSPKFSKIRSRTQASSSAATTATTTGPVRTATTSRLANLGLQKRPEVSRSAQVRPTGPSSATTQGATSAAARSAILASFAYTPRISSATEPNITNDNGEQPGTASSDLPTHMDAMSTYSQQREGRDNPSSSVPVSRIRGVTAVTTATTAATYPSFTKRPLTQPVPFKFATDSLLRKRTAYEPTSLTSFRLEPVKPSTGRPPKPSTAPYQRPLKRLTVPKPFTFQTDLRAEMHHSTFRRTASGQQQQKQHQGQQHPHHGVISRQMLSSKPSRLANLVPVSRSRPTPTAAAPASVRLPPSSLRPPRITVPVSPKLGRDSAIRVVRPVIPFIPKKSTKELTQPVGFRFNTDARLETRRAHIHAVAEEKELEVMESRWMRQQALEHKLATRERLESTFRARPIAQYAPIRIRPAKKAPTVPVSPLIGEKRRRYEAERYANLYGEAAADEVGVGDGAQGHFQPRHHNDEEEDIEHTEVYRQFEEGKLMQEQQEHLKRQLKNQEIRQLELANSVHANVQQPPLRISFPFDPETQALQQDDKAVVIAENDTVQQQQLPEEQQLRGQLQLPALRRTSSGTSNRRINLETSKALERGSPRRISGRAMRTSSPESGADGSGIGAQPKTYEPYYAFTRSMEQTAVPGSSTTARAGVVPVGNNTQSETAADRRHTEKNESLVLAPIPGPAPVSVTEASASSTQSGQQQQQQQHHQHQDDPDRRRSGSFFSLDRDVPPPSSRRISVETGNDPDRRRSGSFIPLETVTATKKDAGPKGKGKKNDTVPTTTTITAKARKSISTLITGAAQKHRLPIPNKPFRGRVLSSTLDTQPSTTTAATTTITNTATATTGGNDTLHPPTNSKTAGQSLSLSDLL